MPATTKKYLFSFVLLIAVTVFFYNNCGNIDIAQKPNVIESIRCGSTDTGNPKFQLKIQHVDSVVNPLEAAFQGCGATPANAAQMMNEFKGSTVAVNPIVKVAPGSTRNTINAVYGNIQEFVRIGEIDQNEAFTCIQRAANLACNALEGDTTIGFRLNESRMSDLFNLVHCGYLMGEKESQ